MYHKHPPRHRGGYRETHSGCNICDILYLVKGNNHSCLDRYDWNQRGLDIPSCIITISVPKVMIKNMMRQIAQEPQPSLLQSAMTWSSIRETSHRRTAIHSNQVPSNALTSNCIPGVIFASRGMMHFQVRPPAEKPRRCLPLIGCAYISKRIRSRMLGQVSWKWKTQYAESPVNILPAWDMIDKHV